MSSPPDPLDPWLDAWKVPGPAPSLAPEVWRRIAERPQAPKSIWAAIDEWLSRPPFAVLFVTCCALCGLFLAEVRLNRDQRAHGAQLARSYLQLIDPLLRPGPVARSP